MLGIDGLFEDRGIFLQLVHNILETRERRVILGAEVRDLDQTSHLLHGLSNLRLQHLLPREALLELSQSGSFRLVARSNFRLENRLPRKTLLQLSQSGITARVA